jgi:hypothetical protein
LLSLEILRVCRSVQNVRVKSFHAATTVSWHFGFRGTNHSASTTQQLAGIRVGDVEIADVDDMSIGDDSPISCISVQWRPFANVVINQQRRAPFSGAPSLALVEKTTGLNPPEFDPTLASRGWDTGRNLPLQLSTNERGDRRRRPSRNRSSFGNARDRKESGRAANH